MLQNEISLDVDHKSGVTICPAWWLWTPLSPKLVGTNKRPAQESVMCLDINHLFPAGAYALGLVWFQFQPCKRLFVPGNGVAKGSNVVVLVWVGRSQNEGYGWWYENSVSLGSFIRSWFTKCYAFPFSSSMPNQVWVFFMSDWAYFTPRMTP